MDRHCFHSTVSFTLGQPGVLSNVDGQVGVERLQLLGKQLISQRVEAVRVPVESGLFQEVESRMTHSTSGFCTLWFLNLVLTTFPGIQVHVFFS